MKNKCSIDANSHIIQWFMSSVKTAMFCLKNNVTLRKLYIFQLHIFSFLSFSFSFSLLYLWLWIGSKRYQRNQFHSKWLHWVVFEINDRHGYYKKRRYEDWNRSNFISIFSIFFFFSSHPLFLHFFIYLFYFILF